MEKIALLPGGFKPPHAGHYNMAKWLVANTDADSIVIKIGSKERDGITRDISLKLWDLYRKADEESNKLVIVPSEQNSPVRDVYDFIEQEAPEGSTVYLGMGEKDIEDQRFKNIGKFAEPKNIKFETVLVPPQAGGVSGTEMRGFIKDGDKESFQKYLPDHLSSEQKDEAWGIVSSLEEDFYDPRNKIYDFAKSSEWKAGMPDGPKDDIPRKGDRIGGKNKIPGIVYEQQGGKTLRVYDFDDTLAVTKGANIKIKHADGSMDTLDPAEFAVYDAQEGDKFDFTEFDKVIKDAEPIQNIISMLEKDLQTTAKVTILTARLIAYPVRRYLKSLGLDAYVVAVGSSDPNDKAKWIENHIEKGYTDILFIDDSEKNRNAVLNLKDKYPDIKLDVQDPDSIKEMIGTMNNQEKRKHAKNLKRLNKDLKKQGNQYMKVPDYLKGTLKRKLYKEQYIPDKPYHNEKGHYTTSVATINNKSIPLEVMRTPDDQITGMMGRDEMKVGMVFPYDNVSKKDFHMEGCLIPLDIVFVNKGTIDNIHSNCPPCKETPCPKYSGMADNVLELPGGYCKKHNINVGDKVNLNLTERKLTKGELKDRERIAKDLPDKEFKKRYGKDWKSVKLATATKMAKKEEALYPRYTADQVQKVRYQASDTFTGSPKRAKKLGYLEGDTYEKMAAKGKKKGNLKQGTVRKRLKIKAGDKIPLSKINKAISRIKKMKNPSEKNKKYLKALNLAKTLKTTTHKENLYEADPKKGTGKKPKGSGRRLYTDENPKDTVKVKFSTRQDIVDTLSKKSFKSKPHKRQSQIINLIHQRVRAALSRTKDPQKKKRLKSAFEYIKKRKEASKRKTQRLKKESINLKKRINLNEQEACNNPCPGTVNFGDAISFCDTDDIPISNYFEGQIILIPIYVQGVSESILTASYSMAFNYDESVIQFNQSVTGLVNQSFLQQALGIPPSNPTGIIGYNPNFEENTLLLAMADTTLNAESMNGVLLYLAFNVVGDGAVNLSWIMEIGNLIAGINDNTITDWNDPAYLEHSIHECPDCWNDGSISVNQNACEEEPEEETDMCAGLEQHANSLGIQSGVSGVDGTTMSAADQFCIKCQAGSYPNDEMCSCCDTDYTYDDNVVTYDPDFTGIPPKEPSKDPNKTPLKNKPKKEPPALTKEWWKHQIKKIITEGGAAGHMAHPFNLPDVNSGKDLLNVFEKATNSLEKDPGSVKIDGVNSSIRLIDLDGEKQFVMDRGSKKELDVKGITKDDLLDRFGDGHGMVKIGGEVLDMFNKALPSIKDDLEKLGAYDDPNILFNMEYVSGKTNVQDYGSNFIAIHGLNKIETKEVQGKRKMLTKRISSEVSYDKSALQSLLDNLAPIAKEKGFEVYGSVPTEMTKKPNFNAALSKTYTIEAGENTQTKSLKNLLDELNNIPEEDFIFMNVNNSRKKVGAVSKQVYLAILNGENVDDLFEDENDKQKAIEGFTTYLATEKLGDEVLKVLDSPMGSVENHEGVVIRDENIANVPFKITGKFILGGLVSDF